jgi:regulator of sigma E protease
MTIGTVAPASAAARAQLRPGDVVVAIGGDSVNRWHRLIDAIAHRPGKGMTLRIRRGDQTLDLQVKPTPDEWGQGRLGIAQQYVHQRQRFWEAAQSAARHERALLWQGGLLLRKLARENVAAEVVRQISAGSASGLDGWVRALAALSLALGLFHLLPLPPLDAGRIAVNTFEAATGRAIHPKLESILHALGTISLIAGLGWLLARDVARLVIDVKLSRGAATLPAARPGGDGTDAGVRGD